MWSTLVTDQEEPERGRASLSVHEFIVNVNLSVLNLVIEKRIHKDISGMTDLLCLGDSGPKGLKESESLSVFPEKRMPINMLSESQK